MPSAYVERLDVVQASLTAILIPNGFTRKGRTFNRAREEGVIQVVNLQAGQFPIGDQSVSPKASHLRSDHYGRFAVNLGVHVREIWEQDAAHRRLAVVQEHHCAIRTRLGRTSAGKDYWWALDAPASEIINDVEPLLRADGIAFLERFATRAAITADWIALNDGSRPLSARARVDVAIIAACRGDRETAAHLLAEQIGRSTIPGHIAYVRRLARDLGLGEL